MENFSQDPRKINMDSIVANCVENANFMVIVELSLTKVKHLDLKKEAEEIKELYNIISAIVEAVDMSIKN